MSKPRSPDRGKRLKDYLWRRLTRVQDKYGAHSYRGHSRRVAQNYILVAPSFPQGLLALGKAYDRYVRLCLLIEDQQRRFSC